MFTKKITESDAFLDMPLSTQALYFHLNMNADDEGFVNNAKRIQRNIGASDDDLKLLILKKFIIPYETGVIVIKHWKMHNYIAKDRFHKSQYEEERSMLEVKENGAYTLKDESLYTRCIQDVYADKNSIDKNSIDIKEKSRKEKPLRNIIPPKLEWVEEYCRSRNNKINAQKFIDFYTTKDWFVGKTKMKDWEASIRTWENRDKEKSDIKPGDYRSMQTGYTDDLFEELEKEVREN